MTKVASGITPEEGQVDISIPNIFEQFDQAGKVHKVESKVKK